MNKFKPHTTVLIAAINIVEMVVTNHAPLSLLLWPLYGIYRSLQDGV